jgi:ABC-type polysaccharide/polyol phosphate export permease
MKALADFREVVGYRELVAALALREIRVRYKYSLLGIGWAIALPVALTLVFTFVFARVANVNTGGIPYPIFAYIGLLPWQLHANIVTGAARSLVDNRNLVTKVYFAREVLPLAHVGSSLLDFFVAAFVLAGLMAWYGVKPGVGLLLVPLVLVLQVCFSLAVGLILAAANLFYRDVQFILQVGMLLWMFASSVVYPIPRAGGLEWLVYANPMTPFIDAYRGLILSGRIAFEPPFWVASAIALVLLVLAWRWFRRVEGRFGELV